MLKDKKGIFIYICPVCGSYVKERWNRKDFYECDGCTFSFHVNDKIQATLILDEYEL